MTFYFEDVKTDLQRLNDLLEGTVTKTKQSKFQLQIHAFYTMLCNFSWLPFLESLSQTEQDNSKTKLKIESPTANKKVIKQNILYKEFEII